jgi:hypothetical protein
MLIACCAIAVAGAQQRERMADDHASRVRFPEGTVHGFLNIHSAAGKFLAQGDLLQLVRNGAIESRMVFDFTDGSAMEESVTFSQHDVFEMQSYHLVQRGPAFDIDLDATLTRDGAWTSKSKSHKDGKEEQRSGTLKLPTDVYNGMILTIAKNMSAKETRTIHLVAFMPEPRLIELAIVPAGEEKIEVGHGYKETATHYTLKPRLGAVTGFFAKLTGKMPPNSQAWIVTDGAPAFVRFQGPLFSGAVMRIDLTAPTWK